MCCCVGGSSTFGYLGKNRRWHRRIRHGSLNISWVLSQLLWRLVFVDFHPLILSFPMNSILSFRLNRNLLPLPLRLQSAPTEAWIGLCRFKVRLSDMLGTHLVGGSIKGEFFCCIPVSLVLMGSLIRDINILLSIDDTHCLFARRFWHLLKLVDFLPRTLSIGRIRLLIGACNGYSCLWFCLENDVLSASLGRYMLGNQVFEGVLVEWTGRCVILH